MKKWNYLFEVPAQKKIRMIVHTDCKNEADDQFALAHHLMTPKFDVRGIIAAHFNINPREYGYGHTAQASLDEIEKILSLMGLEGEYPVVKGAELPLVDENTPQDSPGARMIIEEALREDDRPLFVAFLGGVTDLASAILMEPAICSRMTAVWIGGGPYPNGGREFNLSQDIPAVNIVMRSEMPVWQVPSNVYKQMTVTLAELQLRVRPHGKIGRYLFEQMVDFNMQCAHIARWPHGEAWSLGDSPTIGVLLEEKEKTDIFDMIPAPEVAPDMTYIHTGKNRPIRVYKQVNARLTLEDLYAKLAINYPDPES